MIRRLALIAMIAVSGTLHADDAAWAGFGTGACTMCHAPTPDHPLRSIERSPHGAIPDFPGPGNACEACHGPSAAHLTVVDGVRPPPGIAVGRGAPAGPQNEACVACHTDVGSLRWPHSAHARAELSCTACHTVHMPRDPATVRANQLDDCSTCHQDVRAELHRPSNHPVLSGALACTDCHDPHGGRGDAALVRDSVNETCYVCHADLRGPFLWEHPPVREDCTTCHLPHGSVHDRLMTARTPYLCQQCHLAQFHPSVALSGTGVPPAGASASMLLRDCMSCHTQVHGSNHPSGVRQTR